MITIKVTSLKGRHAIIVKWMFHTILLNQNYPRCFCKTLIHKFSHLAILKYFSCRENETKITKLKKIFLINQYLRGSIDKRCLELITKKLERKLDFSRHRQTCIELSVYFKPGVIFVNVLIRY